MIFLRNLPLFQHSALLLIESLLFLPEFTLAGCKVITYQCIEIFIDRHPQFGRCMSYPLFFPYRQCEIDSVVMLFCVLVTYHLLICSQITPQCLSHLFLAIKSLQSFSNSLYSNAARTYPADKSFSAFCLIQNLHWQEFFLDFYE